MSDFVYINYLTKFVAQKLKYCKNAMNVESGDHIKNGANLKSLMSREIII